MNTRCDCIEGFRMCRKCEWRMRYRLTMLMCACVGSVYAILFYLGLLSSKGAFGFSRWWDIAGCALYFNALQTAIRWSNNSYTSEDRFVAGSLLGCVGAFVGLFWKGIAVSFIAGPAVALCVIAIPYVCEAIGWALGRFFDTFGWWFEGRPWRYRQTHF